MNARPERRSDRLVFAGLELLATWRRLTPAETREHARLALTLEHARLLADEQPRENLETIR